MSVAVLGFIGGIVLGGVALIVGLLVRVRHNIDETHEYQLDSSALDESAPDVTCVKGDHDE